MRLTTRVYGNMYLATPMQLIPSIYIAADGASAVVITGMTEGTRTGVRPLVLLLGKSYST